MATGPSVGVDLGFIDALPDLSAVVDSRWRVVASSRTVRNFVAADVSVDDLVAGASARVQLGPVASAWVHVAVKDITYSVRSSPLGVDLWLITCRPYEGGTILHRPAGLGRDDAVAADVAADVEADVSDIARTRAAFAEATHRSIAILDALDERVCVLEPVMANGELIDLRIVALNRMQREAHGGVFTEGALASVAFVGGTEAPAFAAAREALAGGTPLPYRVVRGNSSFDDPDQRTRDGDCQGAPAVVGALEAMCRRCRSVERLRDQLCEPGSTVAVTRRVQPDRRSTVDPDGCFGAAMVDRC